MSTEDEEVVEYFTFDLYVGDDLPSRRLHIRRLIFHAGFCSKNAILW